MKAIMLAAGVGSRLAPESPEHVPKSLLRFGGKSLLERHVEVLRAAGVASLTVVVGYRAEDIAAEIARLGANGFVQTVDNPDFRTGSVVSLWSARSILRGGGDILFMDADVLYDPAIIERLLASDHRNCLPFDRDFIPGDEPVKLCLKDGVPVEFRKSVEVGYDTVGEWPGFIRFSAEGAAEVADAADRRVQAGKSDEPCEESFREVILDQESIAFGIEDITGLPWIEIDFPEDVVRAEQDILPRIADI
jgi:choline kinase